MLKKSAALGLLASAVWLGMAVQAHADAYINDPNFTTNSLGRNDDNSTGLVPLGFNANFFGLNASSVYVNNNGNITFTAPLSTYTPFNLLTQGTPIIAPFFADVDTNNPASGIVTYGQSTVNGHAAFGVDWPNVGHYAASGAPFDTFQLVLIDRSDIAAGDFDFEFNYSTIGWDKGDVSNVSARAGYSNGTTNSYELAGSGVTGAFLDGGVDALNAHSLNSNVTGQYLFQARDGTVTATPTAVPDMGSTLALLGSSVGALAFLRRRLLA